jgi:hypothetical protein
MTECRFHQHGLGQLQITAVTLLLKKLQSLSIQARWIQDFTHYDYKIIITQKKSWSKKH